MWVVVDFPLEHHPTIPHVQENKMKEQDEELEESYGSDDGNDHVHDDKNHGNVEEQLINAESALVDELKRSSRHLNPQQDVLI